MSLCVEPTEKQEREGKGKGNGEGESRNETTTGRRRIDVTDMHAAGVQEYVRDNVATDHVSLEHRAGQTFLVLEE